MGRRRNVMKRGGGNLAGRRGGNGGGSLFLNVSRGQFKKDSIREGRGFILNFRGEWGGTFCATLPKSDTQDRRAEADGGGFLLKKGKKREEIAWGGGKRENHKKEGRSKKKKKWLSSRGGQPVNLVVFVGGGLEGLQG